ncbi:MAG TPA: hypothetical protein PLR06_12805 [Cyclobacteriaceae bacterium]|nr:hypothetical protein [Cyclobacteriaceae bacterium]
MNFSDLLNSFRQGSATAKSHMKNLIEIAAVDGNFDNVEYDLLKSIAKRNSISESQLKEIRSNPGGVTFELPKDSREKFHQLYDLVLMMSVDTMIHPEEKKLTNLFAVKFGYPKEKANTLVDMILANIQNKQNPDETMKRVEMLIK